MAELDHVDEFDVHEAKPAAQAAKDGPIVRTRWADRPKDGAVRSRLVARGFAVNKRDDVYAATSAAVAGMLIEFLAMKLGLFLM
eukprot:13134493-Alexandrium_andersonii.AAC.1